MAITEKKLEEIIYNQVKRYFEDEGIHIIRGILIGTSIQPNNNVYLESSDVYTPKYKSKQEYNHRSPSIVDQLLSETETNFGQMGEGSSQW